MSTVIGDLFVRLGVDATAMESGLGKAEKTVESMGTRMFFMGSRITAGITLPIVAAGAAVAKFGLDFDKAMTESLAIMDNVTPQIRKEMEEVAIQVAKTTKFSAAEAAEGYYSLASAGLDAATSMKALPIAAEFAQAGVMDLEKATEVLAGTQAALSSGMEDSATKAAEMAHISDVLTEANNRALGTVEDFADALMNKSGAAMRQFNIRLEEGVAVLAAYASQNIRGKVAGQQLMMMIRDLTTYAIKNAGAFQKYGIAVFDSSGNLRHFADIIQDVEKATAGMNVEQKTFMLMQLGIPLRSVAATRALIGQSDAIRQYEKQVISSANVTKNVAMKQMEAFANQAKLLRNEVEILGIRIFQALVPVIQNTILPMFKAFLAIGERVVGFFSAMPAPLRTVTVAFLAMTAAIGPLMSMWGSMSLLASGLMKVMQVLVGGISTYATSLGLAVGGTRIMVLSQQQLAAAQTQAALAAIANARAQGLNAFAANAAGAAARGQVSAQNAANAAILAGAANASLMTRAVTFLNNPITLVIGSLGLLAVAVWAFVKAGEEERYVIENNSKEFVAHTEAMEAAMKTYQDLGYGLSITKEQSEKLDKATRLLAEASGLSADAFNRETSNSDTLINSLNDQIAKRRELAGAYGEGLAAKFNDEKKKLDELEKRLTEVGSGKATKVVWGAGIGSMPTRVEMGLQDRRKEMVQLTGEIITQRGELEKAEKQWLSFITMAEMDVPPMRIPGAPQGEGQPGGLPTGEDKLKGFAKKVQDLYDTVRGTGESELAVIVALWKKHGDVLKNNSGAMAELAERYIRLRKEAHVSSEELDKVFAVQIEGFKKTQHEISQFEDIYGSAGRAVLEDQDKFLKAFENLSDTAEHTEAFWKSNAQGMEALLPFYDEIPPAIQKMLNKYLEWKMTSKETTDAATKNAREAADKITDAADKIAADLEDKRDSLSIYTETNAAHQVKGLQKTLNRQRQIYDDAIDKMKASVDTLPVAEALAGQARIRQAERDRDQILEIMRRENAMRLAEAAGFSKKWIRLHQHLTEEEFQQITKRREAWNDFFKDIQDNMQVLHDMADMLESLGALFGNKDMEDFGKQLAQVGAGLDQFFKGADTVMKAENMAQMMSGIMQMVSGMAKVIKTMMDTVGRAKRAMMGAIAGFQVGFMLGGPVGGLVGAGIGALAGALMKDPRWSEVQEAWKDKYGQAISEGTGRAVEDTVKTMGVSWDAAELINLDKFIADAGGVNPRNLDLFTGKLHDVFSMIETGQMTVEQAADVMSKNFGAVAQAVVDMNQVASPEFADLIRLTGEFGVKVKEVVDFVVGQAGRMAAGLGKSAELLLKQNEALGDKIAKAQQRVADAQKKIDEKKRKGEKPGRGDTKELEEATKKLNELLAKNKGVIVETQAEAERLGRLMLAGFNAALVGGADFFRALEAIGPGLDTLIKAFDQLGIKTDNAALKVLIMQRTFAQKFPEMAAAVTGLHDAFLAASNLGLMRDPAVFKDFEDQLGSTFERVKKHFLEIGGTEKDAFLAIAPMLNSLVIAADKYGLELDDATKKLIEQARAYGLINEKELSTNEILATGFAALLQAMGVDVPQALLDLVPKAKEAADGVGTAFTDAGTHVIDYWENEVGPRLGDEMKEVPEEFERKWQNVMKDVEHQGRYTAHELGRQFEDIVPESVRVRVRWDPDDMPRSEAVAPPTAVGGITARPQVRTVGEAGPEAIIPINKLADVLPEQQGLGAGTVVVMQAGAVQTTIQPLHASSEDAYLAKVATRAVLEAVGSNDEPGYADAMERIVLRTLRKQGLIR